MIKPWVFDFFHSIHDPEQRQDPKAVQRKFQDYIDLWIDDEALGWEGIFFSEHHFGSGYSPSPNLLIAYIAARTTKMRLGVLGTVSPYATPWRVYEEFAMLDQLTQGRLEMGVVSGIPLELGVVGIKREQAAEIHTEILEVLMSAVKNPTVSHHGKHFSFDNLRVTPLFLQSSPAVWTASTSPTSARRAGELGYRMATAFADAPVLAEVVKAFHEGAAAAGRQTGPDDVGLRRVVRVVESEAESGRAVTDAREGTLELFRFAAEIAQIPDTGDHGSQLGKDELIAGTPRQVADEIIRQCSIAGIGNFMAVFNIYDSAQLRRNHELFAKEVIPLLRAAKIDTAPEHGGESVDVTRERVQ